MIKEAQQVPTNVLPHKYYRTKPNDFDHFFACQINV